MYFSILAKKPSFFDKQRIHTLNLFIVVWRQIFNCKNISHVKIISFREICNKDNWILSYKKKRSFRTISTNKGFYKWFEKFTFYAFTTHTFYVFYGCANFDISSYHKLLFRINATMKSIFCRNLCDVCFKYIWFITHVVLLYFWFSFTSILFSVGISNLIFSRRRWNTSSSYFLFSAVRFCCHHLAT